MVPSDEPAGPPVRAVFEAVTVEGGDFVAAAMGRGEPGVPKRFGWRGRVYEVAHVLGSRREVSRADAGAGAYVRRHVVTLLTTSGERMELSGARGSKSGRASERWILRTVVEAGPDGAAGSGAG